MYQIINDLHNGNTLNKRHFLFERYMPDVAFVSILILLLQELNII
ncbi:hypothetical protein [Psychromonas sp. 14N.309.X.WAT.B.A12]|nr:hypothetical protein [Psychromonas sp. 14N.309.X.WAT.B.A12]MDN2662687.1 hypothetical protein [Psychromonas sp. 14N.309.X.WAT.B.A12]